MAEGEQRKLARVFVTCFCGAGCRKEQLQLAPSGDHQDGITVTVHEKPLVKISDAFKDLANVVTSQNHVEVAAFARACSFVAPLFGSIGFHFKFIEMDYVTKVRTYTHYIIIMLAYN